MANILMHRTRSKIIHFLMAHGPATCEDVAAAFSRSALSLQGQLSLLYEAGFLTFESGRYSARPDEIERQLSELAAGFQSGGGDFKTPQRRPPTFRCGHSTPTSDPES